MHAIVNPSGSPTGAPGQPAGQPGAPADPIGCSEPARILIVSPVRNEGAHIERVVRAVARQQLTPARWLVIDDHSEDDTLARLRALERELPFLTVLQAPSEEDRGGVRDGLALAIEARNFNLALATIDWRRYTHVMKLDGDIELPPEYLRVLMEQFACDPLLGLAGGVLVEPDPRGGSRRIAIPAHHVHGALKCYSRECFAAIEGIPERLGWDTIDETYARMRGFRTRSLQELVSVHHRPLASANGTLRGRARHGECAYINHYGALWVTLRSLKVARSRPLGISGLAFLYGYASAAARGVEQVPDPAYRRFTRRELRSRMLGGRSTTGLSATRERGTARSVI
jgi:poly-beta-1,6-N-acetyl-D-glucosamine synthase